MHAYKENYRAVRQRLYGVVPVEHTQPVVPLPQTQADQSRVDREAALVEIWAASAQPTTMPIPIRAGISVRSIMNATRIHFGLREIELISHRRMNTIVRPRQMAMYLAKQHTRLSFPDIGRRIGGFDHTTVLHGVRKIAGYLAAGDFAITHDIAHIENILGIK